MKEFLLNGKTIQIHQLLSDEFSLIHFTTFEQQTLTNIKAWLSGKEIFVFSTSGSTGRPKEINIPRNLLIKSAKRTLRNFELIPKNTVLACLNTEFIAGFMMLIRALEGDLNLIIQDPTSNPLASIELNQPLDFVAMTPIQVAHSLRDQPEKFLNIKKLLIGGASISSSLENQLQKIPVEAYHSYAMTETVTHVALRKINGREKSARYYALDGVSFEQDNRNCLIIHDKMLQIQKLVTNDIVELHDTNTFTWIGRHDLVINSGGIKIQIEKIEKEITEILASIGVNSSFCILAVPDDQLSSKMVLLIEPFESELDPNELLGILKGKLSKYSDPKSVTVVPKLILTNSGKIDRRRNTELYLHPSHK